MGDGGNYVTLLVLEATSGSISATWLPARKRYSLKRGPG